MAHGRCLLAVCWRFLLPPRRLRNRRRPAGYGKNQRSDVLTLLFFRGGGSGIQGGGNGELVSTEGKKRVQYVLRRKEYAFLEELETVLEPVEQTRKTATTPKQLRSLQRLGRAYRMELDSINAAISFIEQRKLELLMEDEMAIILAMMSDDA